MHYTATIYIMRPILQKIDAQRHFSCSVLQYEQIIVGLVSHTAEKHSKITQNTHCSLSLMQFLPCYLGFTIGVWHTGDFSSHQVAISDPDRGQ